MRVAVIFVLIVSLFAFSALAVTSDVSITLMSQSPDPVEPGEEVTVKFKIENGGKETSDDVIVRLLPKHPFELYNDVAEKNIGKLRAGSSGSDAVVVEYKLKIAEDAIEQETGIDVEVEFGGGSVAYTDDELLIDIQTQDAILDITSIKATPSQIAPGESAQITINVKNLADSLLKDVKFTLDVDDIPLAPFGSSLQRSVAQISSGATKPLTFTLIADPTATAGLYKVPVNISYNDEKGNGYNINDILAISIGDTPTLRPFIKKSTVLQAGEGGTVTLAIANSGTTDVKFVELSLLETEDYQLVSTSDYFYIGDIDSDDTESEDIEVYINKKRDELNIPIKLEYVDGNNNKFSQEFTLQMDLFSNSQLKKFGVVQSGGGGWIILILILGGGGYWWYRKYYKKKKDQKKQ